MQLLLKKDFCKPPITSLKPCGFDYEVFIEGLPTFLKKELDLYDELWDYLYSGTLNGKVMDVDFQAWEKDIGQSLASILENVEIWVSVYGHTTKSWKKTKILPD